MAALKGIETLTRSCPVEIVTDSQYLRDGATTWIKGWKARSWRTGRQRSSQERWSLATHRRHRRDPCHHLDQGARPKR